MSPNIIEYNSQSTLQPSDRGIDAAEIAGRRLGVYYDQIGEAVKGVADKVEQHMAVMEASELYKTGADLEVNLEQRLNQETADENNRNDPHFGDRFMAEITPILDKWQSSASTDHGKELAATLGANIRNGIFRKVAGAQAAMDWSHHRENMEGTINSYAASVQLDPSVQNLNDKIEATKEAARGAVAAVPGMTPEQREANYEDTIRRAIPTLVLSRYRAAFESAKMQIGETGDETKAPALAQIDQEMARQVGYEFLDAQQQSELSAYRDEAVRQGRELYSTANALQRRQQDEAVDSAITSVETSLFKDNGAGGVTMAVTPQALLAVQQIAKLPGAGRAASKIEALLNAMHTATQDRLAGKETVTDHGTFVQLSSEIGSTSNPLTTTEVDKAYANGQLNDEDYHFLRTSAVDSKQSAPKAVHAFTELNEWLTKIKPLIDKSNPMLGNMDQTGVQNFSYFSWDATQKLKQMIAAGYDPEHALTMMTDPRNPRGLYSFIPKYQVQDGKAGLHSVIQSITTGKPQPIVAPPGGVHQAPSPRLQGESPADYLKRTGP